jgi:hypothetical protein
MRDVGRWFKGIRDRTQHVPGVLMDLATQALAMPEVLLRVVKTRHPVRLPAHLDDEDDQAARAGYRRKRVILVGWRDTDPFAAGEMR